MRERNRTDWHGKVEHAIGRVMASLDEPIGFREISREVFSSPWHFHRQFRELTGENVQGCIRRLRLERAMDLLRRTEGSVTDIALDSGYETPEAFAKAFRTAYGMKPTDARRLERWDGSLYSRAGIHYDVRQPARWFYLSGREDGEVDTKIVSFEKRRMIGVENVGDYWGLPKAWEKLQGVIAANGLSGSAKAWMCVFPDHDDRIAMADKHSFAAIEVPEAFENTFGLAEIRIPEGLYAVTVHFGASEEIGPTWDRWIREWLPASGWKTDVARPMYEWYQNACVPPELQLTFLCTPVVRAE